MNAHINLNWQRIRNSLLVALLILGIAVVTYSSGTRAASCSAGTIASVNAVGDDGNQPGNVLDGDLATRWSNEGVGSWITADLGQPQPVCGVEIAWYQGDSRANHFVVQGSLDGETFTDLFGGDSSGQSLGIEPYTFAQQTDARYLRVVVNGNTSNEWASISELHASVFGGADAPAPAPEPTVAPDPAAENTADTQPVAENTVDVQPVAADVANTQAATVDAAAVQTIVSGKGFLISSAELALRPMSGTSWTKLKSVADGSLGTPKISDQNSLHDTNTLAVALVYARTGQVAYRTKAANAIMSAIGTEAGGRTLALGRNLVSYVIAADLIDLKSYDAAKDQQFRAWLSAVRTRVLDSKTLINTHEQRPNNWGTHAGASRIAADLYLGDTADLNRAAIVFQGWLGDRAAYAKFSYGQLDWQADPSKPVGINPAGATKSGHSIDGVLPDDQRRAGGFTWPPQKENYVWEALQGAVVEAHLLSRAGYDAWNWSNKAMLRSVNWEYNVNNFPATGDDTWEIWMVNRAYGSSFAVSSCNTGKNMGYTDWMFGR